MTPQEEFISIYKEHITRKGADELLDWLTCKLALSLRVRERTGDPFRQRVQHHDGEAF